MLQAGTKERANAPASESATPRRWYVLGPHVSRKALAVVMATCLRATATLGESDTADTEDPFELSIEELMSEEITSAATLTEASARTTLACPGALEPLPTRPSRSSRTSFRPIRTTRGWDPAWGDMLDPDDLPADGAGDYRSEAPAVAVSLKYEF